LLGLSALALLLVVLLIPCERRAAEPVLPPRLFTNAVVVVSSAVIGLTAMALFGPLVFLPLYFQLVRGVSATHAGLLLAPLMGGVIVSSIGGGRLVSVLGRYKIFPILGLAASAGAFLGMAWAAAGASHLVWMVVLLVILGLGLGLVMPTLTVAIQNAVERADLGVATSASAYFRSLGGALGVAVAGAVMILSLHHQGSDASLLDQGVQTVAQLPATERAATVAAYREAIAATFLAGAVLALFAFALVLFLPELPLRSGPVGAGKEALAAAQRSK
jgi:MFS family permease